MLAAYTRQEKQPDWLETFVGHEAALIGQHLEQDGTSHTKPGTVNKALTCISSP